MVLLRLCHFTFRVFYRWGLFVVPRITVQESAWKQILIKWLKMRIRCHLYHWPIAHKNEPHIQNLYVITNQLYTFIPWFEAVDVIVHIMSLYYLYTNWVIFGEDVAPNIILCMTVLHKNLWQSWSSLAIRIWWNTSPLAATGDSLNLKRIEINELFMSGPDKRFVFNDVVWISALT